MAIYGYKKAATLLLGFALCVIAQANENPPAAYASCQTCHGDKGQGNDAMGAPSLAGQNDWYLLSQLDKFKSGQRGAHESDTFGAQMRPFAQMLSAPDQALEVSQYLATLEAVSTKGSTQGDMMNGSRYYHAKCGACHGGKAEGNDAFKAPKLSGLSAQYLARQMSAFQSGVRGYKAEDKTGRQMAMMAKTVSDSELNDIIHFIAEQH